MQQSTNEAELQCFCLTSFSKEKQINKPKIGRGNNISIIN